MGIDRKSWCRRKCHKGFPAIVVPPGPDKLCLDVELDTYAYKTGLPLSTDANWKTAEIFMYHEAVVSGGIYFRIVDTQAPFDTRFRFRDSGGTQYEFDYLESDGTSRSRFSGMGTIALGKWMHWVFKYQTADTGFVFAYGDLSGGPISYPAGYTIKGPYARASAAVSGFAPMRIVGTNASIGIGSWSSTAPDNPVDARFAEVRLWLDERTDAELTMYNSMFLTGAEAGLLNYYRLNDVTGSLIAPDLGPLGADLDYYQGVNGLVGFADSPFL